MLGRDRRRTWKNHTRNQSVDPVARVRPAEVGQVAELVKQAQEEGLTVRAVGSGHSWSDVALAPGYLVDPGGLAAFGELESDVLRDDLDREHLVRTEAGIIIRDLNGRLHARGLALKNMGGYDGQTLAGIISTATHGSGMSFGPIADAVRSLDMVVSDGALVRIEPEDGPTDLDKWRAAGRSYPLEKRDDWFHAAVVSMGCLGVIHSLMLEVRDDFWLKEVRRLSEWSRVKPDLANLDFLRAQQHYEVYFSPYRQRGGDDHPCIVTTRDEVIPKPTSKPKGERGRRNMLVEALSPLPITPWIINLIVDWFPRLSPRLLESAIKGLADDEYENVSYRIFNIGAANYLPAYSAEIGVPVDERNLHVQAVEKVMEVAERYARYGDIYETSPISLRFVKESPAYMAMMNGRDTMMIELIQLTRTYGGLELLAAYEEALYELEGRPHWGQINTLSGGHDLLARMYPRFPDWLAVHDVLNRSGVFASPFSNRVGITRHELGRSQAVSAS